MSTNCSHESIVTCSPNLENHFWALPLREAAKNLHLVSRETWYTSISVFKQIGYVAWSVSPLKVRSELVLNPGGSVAILISYVNGENVPIGLTVPFSASIFSINLFNSSIFISPTFFPLGGAFWLWRGRTGVFALLMNGGHLLTFWDSPPLCWDEDLFFCLSAFILSILSLKSCRVSFFLILSRH